MTYNNLSQLAQQLGIVLGSRSPRRNKLLSETGIPFTRIFPDLHEEQLPDEPPYDFAERLAQDKALSLRDKLSENQLVIGCDTIVVLNNRVLGKPADEKEAFDTLRMLSGKQHVVCTAVAFADNREILSSGYELTTVYFNNVTDEQLSNYIKTGEPMDKAGAYGIQGMGAFLVDRIEGNLDTVIGLPRTLCESLAGKILQRINLRK